MRQNVLYIFTDQQQANAMSCAGNDLLHTPAADRLAAEGLRFTRAYCAQPVCIPSRAAMQTGRWPHANGVTINHSGVDLSLGFQSMSGARPMLAQTFADAGYDTAYFGRWHIMLPTERSELHGYRTVVQHNADDAQIAPALADYLATLGADPFFAVVSICNPHDICLWPKGGTMPNGDIPEAPAPEDCPSLPDNFEAPDDEPSVLREFQSFRAPHYKAPYFEPHQWRQYRWAYWRFVELADAVVGNVIDAMEQRGLRDNTVIVFSSDHGEGAAAHRWCQKQTFYEESTRVPFIIAPPQCTRAGETDDRLLNAGVDLYPTLCDLAGIDAPHWLHGQSALRPREEASDFVVVETEFHGGDAPIGARGRMLRTDRCKYAAFSRGEPREQLFDLHTDPGETRNIARDPEREHVLIEHRQRLLEWSQRFDDYHPHPRDLADAPRR
jgi:arylsulfatase A-like enzyme